MRKKKSDQVNFLLVGVGGCGCNTINRLIRSGVSGCDFLAIDTDHEHLGLVHKNAKKMLIGQASLHGKGTRVSPHSGAEAAERARRELEKTIGKWAVVFLFAGMGGGTGTGAAPIIADIAKKNGALTIAFATIPFKLERARRVKAKDGIKNLAKSADSVILMENDRLVKLVPNLPMNEAFAVTDEMTAKAVTGCISAISRPSLTGFDFADFRVVFANGGFGFLAWGEGKGKDKVKVALKGLSKNVFLNANWTKAKRAFVQVLIGKNGTLGETIKAVEGISKKMDIRVLKYIARMGPVGDETMEISVLATGVPMPDFSGMEQFKRLFFKAVKKGELNRVMHAVWYRDVDVNARDKDGCTPLHYAVHDLGTVLYLVGSGTDVNARDKLGAQPIHCAAFMGKLDVVKYLVEKGADVNSKGPGNATPLHNAVHWEKGIVKNSDYEGIVRFLIEKGADVNAPNSKGYPPLNFARDKEIIKLLKKAGAKRKKVD